MAIPSTFRAYAAIALFLAFVPAAPAQYSGGSGTADAPYQIATAADLIALGETPEDYDKHFILTADIDLDPNLPGGRVFDRAVIAPGWETPFSGVFDGNGHTILHLTVTGGSSLGLFGRVAGHWAEVRNVGIADVHITGSSDFVGGLAGHNDGRIAASYSTGSVSGDGYVGGLVGRNGDSGEYYLGGASITSCYSTGSVSGTGGRVGGLVGDNYGNIATSYSSAAVTGDWYVGGLVGYNAGGSIDSCYSSGAVISTGQYSYVGGLVGDNGGNIASSYSRASVSGGEYVGGLVGRNTYGSTETSYSTGLVSGTEEVGGLVGSNTSLAEGVEGIVSHSFWDTQTSGQVASSGGIGRTTAEMQTGGMFLDAGWDFVDETKNGTEDIWWIDEGRDYPRLWWQYGRVSSPDPWDGARDVLGPWILTWIGGGLEFSHDVYFGDDEVAVASATSQIQGVYRGRQAGEMTTYDPGPLECGVTYYWRIDEIKEDDPESLSKGRVCSFTTADYVVVSVVDDFESYNDEDNFIFQTWLDGFSYGDPNNPAGDAKHPLYYAGNGTGALVGYMDPPFAEQWIVHGGGQSMPMDYDNDGTLSDSKSYKQAGKLFYSEAERTWEPAQDWAADGANTLTLYFHGERVNDLEQLYVGIEDGSGWMAVVVHPDAEAVLATQWRKWHIALADVRAAGVDVAAVKKMVIGVGDRNNPQPGGTGRIYIDDIRLTKRMP